MAPIQTTSKEQYKGITTAIQRIKTTTASQIESTNYRPASVTGRIGCGSNEGEPISKSKHTANAKIGDQNVNQVALHSKENVSSQGSILIVSITSLLGFLTL